MGTSIALQEIVTFTLSTHMITGLYHHKVELYNTSAHICTCWRVSHLCTHMPEDNTLAPHMCRITTQAHPMLFYIQLFYVLH